LDRILTDAAFFDEHRAHCGIERSCSALLFAPSANRRHAARQRNSAPLSARAQCDASLAAQVQRVAGDQSTVASLRLSIFVICFTSVQDEDPATQSR